MLTPVPLTANKCSRIEVFEDFFSSAVCSILTMANEVTNGGIEEMVELWRHSDPKSTEMYMFQQHISKRHGLKGPTYNELWQWSIDHPGEFWKEIWEYTGIKASKPPSSVSMN